MPVIGLLHPTSLEGFAESLRGFCQGLKETGYVEGENVAFEFRWADAQLDRLPELTADLVRRRVAVIATASPPAAFAAKEASATIPIVFGMAQDPVKLGLVASLARPGGNATGFTTSEYAISGKWLELLKEIAPGVARVAVLRDSTIPAGIGQFASIQTVAQSFGVELAGHARRQQDRARRHGIRTGIK
jgi:putative ABC transport system substrate-binding protein